MTPNKDFGRIWKSFWNHFGVIFRFKKQEFWKCFLERNLDTILDGFWTDFGGNFGCFLESKKVKNRSSENMKNLCFPIEKHRCLRFEGGCFGNKIDAKTESEVELVLGMIFG